MGIQVDLLEELIPVVSVASDRLVMMHIVRRDKATFKLWPNLGLYIGCHPVIGRGWRKP
jgi:hypothetical protein